MLCMTLGGDPVFNNAVIAANVDKHWKVEQDGFIIVKPKRGNICLKLMRFKITPVQGIHLKEWC